MHCVHRARRLEEEWHTRAHAHTHMHSQTCAHPQTHKHTHTHTHMHVRTWVCMAVATQYVACPCSVLPGVASSAALSKHACASSHRPDSDNTCGSGGRRETAVGWHSSLNC